MTPMMVTPYSTMESTDASCLPHSPAPAVAGDTRKHSPEEDLLFAILNNAMEDYLNGAPPAPTPRARLRAEAEQFFASQDEHWGSYLYCCRVLGLDPDYLWARRADWRRWQPRAGLRTQPTGRRAAA